MNGINSELVITKALEMSGIKAIPNAKYDHICSLNYRASSYIKKCSTILNESGILNTIDQFSLVQCQTGASADVALYTRGRIKHLISIKHNNNSCKHQRPAFLCNQLGIKNNTTRQKYADDYKKINDKWYRRWKHLEHFRNVPFGEKKIWYEDINRLTKSVLEKHKSKMVTYMNFLYGSDTKYIFKLDLFKETLVIYKKDLCMQKLVDKIDMRLRDNFIDIFYDEELFMKMRLHNSTSRIKQNLGIKYDTIVYL